MTDPTLLREIQEDLERQRLNDLWRRYGPLTVMVAIIIVAGTAGYTAWHSWKVEKDQKATAALTAILAPNAQQQQAQTPAVKLDALQDFAQTHPNTSEGMLAQLSAAALAAKQNDNVKAVAMYDAVAGDAKAEPAFRQYADLMSIELQMDAGDIKTLQTRLQPLAADGAPWRFSAMEDQAYLALRANDKAQAREILTHLSQAADAPPTLSQRATDSLRLLAD